MRRSRCRISGRAQGTFSKDNQAQRPARHIPRRRALRRCPAGSLLPRCGKYPTRVALSIASTCWGRTAGRPSGLQFGCDALHARAISRLIAVNRPSAPPPVGEEQRPISRRRQSTDWSGRHIRNDESTSLGWHNQTGWAARPGLPARADAEAPTLSPPPAAQADSGSISPELRRVAEVTQKPVRRGCDGHENATVGSSQCRGARRPGAPSHPGDRGGET